MYNSVSLSRPSLSQPADHIVALCIGNMWPAEVGNDHFIWLFASQGVEVTNMLYGCSCLFPVSCELKCLCKKNQTQASSDIIRVVWRQCCFLGSHSCGTLLLMNW